MNKPVVFDRLAVAIILLMSATSWPVIAATDNQPTTDQASELLEREGQSVLLEETVPSAIVSKKEVNETVKKRQQSPSPLQVIDKDLESLVSDPILLTKSLKKAVATHDIATINQLLPYYKALSGHDPGLTELANAERYRSEGHYKQAIAIYRKKLADNPNDYSMRLLLANTLKADKQYLPAEEQLNLLQAEEVPTSIKAKAKKAGARIERTEDWRFSTSASYIKDGNINNAPPKAIQEQFGKDIEQQSANGLQLSARATKRFNLPKNYYATLKGNVSLKGYWDASDYNDYLFTVTMGAGYDDAKNDISVTPFITRRIYNEEPRSIRQGVTLRASRWMTPKLKLTATGLLSNETYDNDNDNRRKQEGQFAGLNVFYKQNPSTYYYGGLGQFGNDVQSVTSRYNRDTLNVGWGQKWPHKLSTRATASYSIKEYGDPTEKYTDNESALQRYYDSVGGEMGANRTDKTTSLGLQVWKRDFTLLSMMPRLVVNYDKTLSNFAYYDDRNETSATVLLSKNF